MGKYFNAVDQGSQTEPASGSVAGLDIHAAQYRNITTLRYCL
jgi:hypothetical protein